MVFTHCHCVWLQRNVVLGFLHTRRAFFHCKGSNSTAWWQSSANLKEFITYALLITCFTETSHFLWLWLFFLRPKKCQNNHLCSTQWDWSCSCHEISHSFVCSKQEENVWIALLKDQKYITSISFLSTNLDYELLFGIFATRMPF